VRILGEHNWGKYIPQYQIKKIPNSPEFEKNLVPPAIFSNIKECGGYVGRIVGNGF
jgi:hypothetical protein